jgi:hypothetical protein
VEVGASFVTGAGCESRLAGLGLRVQDIVPVAVEGVPGQRHYRHLCATERATACQFSTLSADEEAGLPPEEKSRFVSCLSPSGSW